MVNFSQRGSALTNALIAILVLSVSMVAIQRTLTDSKKSLDSSRSRDAVETLHDLLSGLMQNQENCKATLQALTASPPSNGSTLAVEHIKDPSNNNVLSRHTGAYDLSRVYINNSVTIKSMNFIMPSAVGANATFEVTYERFNPTPNVRTKVGYGAKDIKKSFPVVFQRDSSNNYLTCYAVETGITDTNLATYCEQFGELFYWDNVKKACLLNDNRCNDQIFVGINADGTADCRDLEDWADLSPLFDTTTTHPCDPANASQVRFVYSVPDKVSLKCEPDVACTPPPACPSPASFGATFSSAGETFGASNWTALSGHLAGTVAHKTIDSATDCEYDYRTSTACNSSGAEVRKCRYNNSAGTGCIYNPSCDQPVTSSGTWTSGTSYSVNIVEPNGANCSSVTILTSSTMGPPFASFTGGCSTPRTVNNGSAPPALWVKTQTNCVAGGSSPESNLACIPLNNCTAIAATYCPTDPTQNDACGNNCGVGTKSTGCISATTQCTLNTAATPVDCGNGIILFGGTGIYDTRDASNNITGTCNDPTDGCLMASIGSRNPTCPALPGCPTACSTTPNTCPVRKAALCTYQDAGTDACGNTCGNGTAPVVAGGWTTVNNWSAWSACSAGSRTRTGTRTCTNPSPSCGGAACAGCTGGGCPNTDAETETDTTGCAVSGKCQGWGTDTANLIAKLIPDSGTCASYRYQYLDINTTNMQIGNIYDIGIASRTVTAIVLAGDTATTVLNRIANAINSGNMVSTGACGTSAAQALVTGNQIAIRQQWQHSVAFSASRSCNIADQATCTATPGCSWDTTSPNVCTGTYYTVPQGRCNGTFMAPGCAYSGFGSGDPATCESAYWDQTSCNADSFGYGCYWGTVPQSCYGSDSASCSALGGTCTWDTYPNMHRNCTAPYGQTSCTTYGSSTCTWAPP